MGAVLCLGVAARYSLSAHRVLALFTRRGSLMGLAQHPLRTGSASTMQQSCSACE